MKVLAASKNYNDCIIGAGLSCRGNAAHFLGKHLSWHSNSPGLPETSGEELVDNIIPQLTIQAN